MFENPEGDTAGRVWPHMDMLPRVFEFEEITKAHDFYLGCPNNSPAVVLCSHFDGYEETSFAHITNGVLRLAGLRDRSRNPAALLVHLIDEGVKTVHSCINILVTMLSQPCAVSKTVVYQLPALMLNSANCARMIIPG